MKRCRTATASAGGGAAAGAGAGTGTGTGVGSGADADVDVGIVDVLVVPCSSDPPTCHLVSMAAAIVEKGVAREVWLLPYGSDYTSPFNATPIAR